MNAMNAMTIDDIIDDECIADECNECNECHDEECNEWCNNDAIIM